MSNSHHYEVRLLWRGQEATGPVSYTSYSRAYEIACAGKPSLAGSADPAFRGDPARHNPEDLFVAAVSACHMLTYLALCARRGILVARYEDAACGTLQTDPPPGRFTEIVLRPRVMVAGGDAGLAGSLHDDAHQACFIANSVRVPVRHEAMIEVVS
jgi:organic hydroperoxide reductase OsmC/OhrA